MRKASKYCSFAEIRMQSGIVAGEAAWDNPIIALRQSLERRMKMTMVALVKTLLRSLWGVCACLLIALAGCEEAALGPRVDATFVKETGERTAILRLEVAATPESRAMGLSKRAHPGVGRGVVLLYPGPNEHLVSNDQVLDPVDFVFVAPNGRIAGIVADVPMNDSQPRTVGAPSSAVLILAAGMARQLGISRGDMVLIQGALPKPT